jgi:hypothetical protein
MLMKSHMLDTDVGFLIQQTVANANRNLTRNYKLRYSLNGGGYTDLGAQSSATDPIRYADSPNITDNEATTQQIGTGSFVTGAMLMKMEILVQSRLPHGALSETELEFVIEIYGGRLLPSDTLDLRVFETNNTVLAAYTVTPRTRRPRRLRVLG